MMKFEISKATELSKLRIDSIQDIIASFGGLIFHELDFNKIAAKYFNTQLSYIFCYKNDEIIGICPLHNFKRGFTNNYYSKVIYDVPYGGWVYNEKKVDLKTLLSSFINQKNSNSSIFYASNILKNIDEKQNVGQQSFHETAIIDLSIGEEEIWNSISPKKRNKVRKAEKQNIKISEDSDKSNILKLISDLHQKLNYSFINIDFYSELIDFYAPQNKAKILIAELDNEPISGVLIIGNENYVHYWKGASKNNVKNLGQGELLQWESIKYAKRSNSKKYDFCVVDKENHPGIYEFKTSFSRNIVPFFSIEQKPISYKIFNKISKWLSNN